MRPLVYTELPPSETQEEQLQAEDIVNIAPDDLGFTLFHAIVARDRETYDKMFISPEELSALVRSPLEKARQECEKIKKNSEILWTLFASDSNSEDPMTGAGSSLTLSEFRLGKGRNLAGKTATDVQDEAVQHWGNDLRLALKESEKVFAIRLPKIVRTPKGWRIAGAIEVDPSLQIYLEAGMYLSANLMSSQHYPFPLEVGNYWKYDVKHTAAGMEDEQNNKHLEGGETITDSITQIKKNTGYWLVEFERSSSFEGVETKKLRWLASPRKIYICDRDCSYNINNISFLLNYMIRKTPIYNFPLTQESAWGVAGRKTQRNRYEAKMMPENGIHTIAGDFRKGYVISGSVEEGREERFFIPGTGVVERSIRTGSGIRKESLITYRLIL